MPPIGAMDITCTTARNWVLAHKDNWRKSERVSWHINDCQPCWDFVGALEKDENADPGDFPQFTMVLRS